MRLTRDVLGAVVVGLAAVGAASAANIKSISAPSRAQHRNEAKATEHLSKAASVTFTPGDLTKGTTVPANPALELSHGYELLNDLESVGGQADIDDYKISQKPFSSYEAVVDSTSGDIGRGLKLDLIANDGSTVLVPGQDIGVGFSRSLRFMNNTAAEINDEVVRVQSNGCQTDCGPDDIYFIRGYETTYSIPRFNNTSTQITVMLLQNPTNYPIAGTIYFWNPAGTQVGNFPFNLAAKQVLVLNTAGVAPGTAGAASIVHDGRYGDLSAKTVALEPATGFSFDSPALVRANITGRTAAAPGQIP